MTNETHPDTIKPHDTDAPPTIDQLSALLGADCALVVDPDGHVLDVIAGECTSLDVVRIASRLAEPSGLVFVPALVQQIGLGGRERVHQAARDGLLELRPESGLGRLTGDEAELCPRAFDGTPCSWARVVGGAR